MFKHALGEYVVEQVSGFEGVITARLIRSNGCMQYTIQPKIKEGEQKLPDSYWYDADFFVVDLSKSLVSPHGQPDFKFNLGDEVRSTKINFSGLVEDQVQYLNGCIRYTVMDKELNKERTDKIRLMFDETELELVKKEAVTQDRRTTGGPSVLASNGRC